MRTFGCSCLPLLPPTYFHKLQPKSIHCVFLGYASNYKGYWCLDPKLGRVYISRHVSFLEDMFPYVGLLNHNQANLINDVRQSLEHFTRPWTVTHTTCVDLPVTTMQLSRSVAAVEVQSGSSRPVSGMGLSLHPRPSVTGQCLTPDDNVSMPCVSPSSPSIHMPAAMSLTCSSSIVVSTSLPARLASS